MHRLIAIGDIHGHRAKLDDLLNQIQPTGDDQFVFLGDYVDRGPDSKGVIDKLIDFKQCYPQTVFLRGNHDQMFLDALISCKATEGVKLRSQSIVWDRELISTPDVSAFKGNGGIKTLESYDAKMVPINEEDTFCVCTEFVLSGEIPQEHIDFIKATSLYFEHGKFIFVHAGLGGGEKDLDKINPHILLWDRDLYGGPDGKTLVIGHTACPDGEPLISADLIMVDTGAGYGKPLSAIDLNSMKVWQSACD